MMLANWIGAPYEEVDYVCAGINHQAWYLKYQWKGEDAYPLIREAVAKPEIYQHEIVRNEMFLALDYYVTESSGHNSEYNWWFRKRPDLIEKYCTHGTGWNPGVYAYILNEYLRRESDWKQDVEAWFAREEPLNLKRGNEYAAYIINAYMGGEPFEFNGNVPNTQLITNLPEGVCVEVPGDSQPARSQSDPRWRAAAAVGCVEQHQCGCGRDGGGGGADGQSTLGLPCLLL